VTVVVCCFLRFHAVYDRVVLFLVARESHEIAQQ
jgi:hypothetical protein